MWITLTCLIKYITELYQVLVNKQQFKHSIYFSVKFKKANFQSEMKINNAWNKFKQQI